MDKTSTQTETGTNENKDTSTESVNTDTTTTTEDTADTETSGSSTDTADESTESTESTENSDDTSSDSQTTENELDTDVWGTTNDEIGDSVLLVLQNSGIDVEEAKALIYDPLTQHGDPTKLDRDKLVEKVGKANANLVLAGIENFVSKNNAKNAEILNSVYEVAGGKDNWDKVSPWAKANLSETERNELSEMLDAGGAKAKFAATEIVNRFNQDPKNTSIGKSTTFEGDSTAGTQLKATTRAEYVKQLEELYNSGNVTDAAVQAIQKSRLKGRKQGI